MNNSKQQEHTDLAKILEDLSLLIGKKQAGEITLSTGEQVHAGLELLNRADQLSKKATSIRSGELTIAVCGGVSAGKTTFINALTGLTLPTGADAKTGLVCYITYGDETGEFEVFFADGSSETMDLDTFIEFSSLEPSSIQSGNPYPLPDRLQTVRRAETNSSAPICKSGVRFVDTLGFNAGPLAEDTTAEALQTADIILMVLGSRPPFTQADIDFFTDRLDGLDESKSRLILFVLNDFGLREDEKEDVIKGAGIKLEGIVEDFESQVFMVNAYEAAAAKLAGSTDETLEVTGLPKIERTLSNYLHSEEGPWQFIRQATVERTVLSAIRNARTTIADNVVLLNSETSQLTSLENAFDESRAEKARLLSRFRKLQNDMGDAINADFHRQFITHNNPRTDRGIWRTEWEKLSPEIGWFDLLKAIQPFQSRESKEDRKRALQGRLEGPMRKLVGGELEKWQKQLPGRIEPIMQEFAVEFEGIIKDFSDALTKADVRIIALDAVPITIPDPSQSDKNFQRILQLVVGTLQGDPNQWIGAVYTPNWWSFFRRFLVDVIAVVVLGPFGLMVVVLGRIFEFFLTLALDRRKSRNVLSNAIADEMLKGFRAEAPRIAESIRGQVNNHFESHFSTLETILDQEIVSRETRWNDLREAKGTKKTLASEQARLEQIDTCLTAQWKAASQLVYGEVISESEVEDRKPLVV